MILQKLPIGVEDFDSLRQNDYYFVDKTQFIADFLDRKVPVLLMTRPRRFGKTLTLSMLQYFFSYEHAEENRKLFTGLAVEKSQYMSEQGKYPTVFLSLKDCKANSWQNMQKRLQILLQDVYKQYLYLLDSEKLSVYDKAYIQRILRGTGVQADYENALVQLTSFLAQHYKKKVVLLIDEYDVPIQQSFEHGYYDDYIVFMRNFLSSALKTNPSLEFAILTGVLRVAKESIFSGLNNFMVSSVVNQNYATVMGFTREEVTKMASDYHCADKMAEIRAWYDGYRFGEQEIYNPWSVLNYFYYNGKPKPYWVNTSGNGLLGELLHFASVQQQKDLQNLLLGQSVTATIDEGVVYQDIFKNSDVLYTLMLETGYLTAKDMQDDDFGLEAELVIPNKEVRRLYRREVLMRVSAGNSLQVVRNVLRALLHGDANAFQEQLQQMLLQLVSVYDAANKESFYHGLMLGLTALLASDYEIESNRESGYGRFDLALFPKDKTKAGVILEFKVADSEAELETKAQEALQQIADREYQTEFSKRDMSVVWQYGISFCGKKIFVTSFGRK